MSKKYLISLTVVLSLIMVMLFAIPLGGCAKEEEEFPVWELSETVKVSFSDNGNYGYILTVEGTGGMPEYQSKKDTPWYGKSGRVTEIVVSDGITSICENAFSECFYVKSVELPESVKKIGENAFPATTKVYCYATGVTAGEGMTVYTYSENQPTVGGNFWHLVNGAPAAWPYVVTSPQKILFIGNSYTFYNDMPTLFQEIANNAGAEVTAEYITTGSQSLKIWADPSTEDGARVEAALTASSDYDIIVLQEKSTSPVNDDYRYFVSGAKALAERIEETQDSCRVFLYETWGSPAYAGNYGGTVTEMESRLRAAYDTVAEKIGATVSYVGKAFSYVYENRADINLYADDKTHPSYEGSYLAACVHATSLLGLNVQNSTYNGTLDADTAEYLRQVGYSVVVGAEMPEITYDMSIAVFGRYADASVIANLVAAFKQDYAAKNDVKAPAIKYSLLGASNTTVAAFGEMINAGSYDMILAAGNNINTTGGVSVEAKKSYHVKDSVYPGGTDRYVCRLTENEFAVAFYNFMDTDAAKVVLDPDYVPEVINEITLSFVVDGSPYGTPVTVSSASSASAQALPGLPEKDTFIAMGWALTEEEAENETLYNGTVTYATFEGVATNGEVTLYARYVGDGTTVITVNIAVFKRYVEENTIISLVSAFKETYTVNEDERLNVTYELLGNGSTGAGDFGALVNAGNFNITFGSGNNVDSSSGGGVTVEAKKSVYLADYKGDRTVAYLTQDDATKAFYNFLDTDAAKKIMNPDYVSEDEADIITINLTVSGTVYGEAIVISNATEATAKSLPAPEAATGFVFSGWATTEQAQDEEELIPAGAISYEKASELATGDTLTLYARFLQGEDPQTKILNIAFYGKFMLEDTAVNLIEAFKTAYASDLVGITVKYDVITSTEATNNSKYAEKVKAGNSDGDKYDIAIGYKHTNSAKVEVGQTENVTVNMYNCSTAAENEARHACIIGNDESAQKFMEFLGTDEAKAILLSKPSAE